MGPEMSDEPVVLRILVVDDDVRVADSLVQILIARGYEAVPAYSAEAAIRMAEKLDPHAVISDIVMGPVSGIELANHLREHHPDCNVLLISGFVAAKETSQAVLAPSSRVQFMAKPVRPEHVLDFLAACPARSARTSIPSSADAD